MAGMFRFVCMNGLVCGDVTSDVRVRHSGNIVGDVIDGAFRVLETLDEATEKRDAMRSLTLNPGEQQAFAHAALALKYDDESKPAPITERQVLQARRRDDTANDMWSTFNVVQENIIKGGLRSRTANGRRATTREVTGIDQGVKLNRALWILAEEMRKLKA